MYAWQLQEAKARFSEHGECAQSEELQITRLYCQSVVVVSHQRPQWSSGLVAGRPLPVY
jgi:hypothetical protein